MEKVFEIDFTFEQKHKEKIMARLSTKQGGKNYVFSYLWECFAWAAIIGFINDKRVALKPKLAERPFNLKTMQNNGGDKIAKSLICLCIAKAGTVEILKDHNNVINMINEYANGGFYYIQNLIDTGENRFNDFEDVKQEIFGREA